MGNKYTVYLAKYPYQGYWEGMQGFDKFDKAVNFAKKMMKLGYDIIDIQCRDIKESKNEYM